MHCHGLLFYLSLYVIIMWYVSGLYGPLSLINHHMSCLCLTMLRMRSVSCFNERIVYRVEKKLSSRLTCVRQQSILQPPDKRQQQAVNHATTEPDPPPLAPPLTPSPFTSSSIIERRWKGVKTSTIVCATWLFAQKQRPQWRFACFGHWYRGSGQISNRRVRSLANYLSVYRPALLDTDNWR